MARKRAPMGKIREIVRLGVKELSQRQIAKATGLSRPVVSEYLQQFKDSGLSAEQFCTLDDEAIEELLTKGKSKIGGKLDRLREKFPKYSQELKRTGVTLWNLWKEYLEEEPTGYSYSQFCHHYNQHRSNSKLEMHMDHKSGDKAFVDFTGKKISYVDAITGAVSEAEIFVGVLGASLYTYVEAVESQKIPDWLKASENMLHFFGGVPQAIMPDNLKSAVTKASKYEPEINIQYLRFAEHYDTVVFPARPYKPKDKALVENTVNVVYSRIFAPLRDRIFYSIREINEEIGPLLKNHNQHRMKAYEASRHELYEKLDKPFLKALPVQRHEYRQCEERKVQFNYHVLLGADNHYYSVPFNFRGKKVEVWYGISTVEILHKNSRIALHLRTGNAQGKYSTTAAHMPPEHKWLNDWNPERLTRWAEDLGENVKSVVSTILEKAAYPEQSYKVCMGILALGKKFGTNRLDKACGRAMHYCNYSFKSIRNILENGLDKHGEDELFDTALPCHENIRGKDYYNEEKET